MPEWLIERGIGEIRAALVDRDRIVEARILLDDTIRAGSVIAARIVNSGADGRNAVARDDGGAEYLLPRGAGRLSQGSPAMIEVTREAIPGVEPWKRPLARITDKPAGVAAALEGRNLPFPSPTDELAKLGWDDLVEEARSGVVRFAGGELRISPTPAMTLIDVDGHLPPDELAQRGARAAAEAIMRFDIGGSIGIDLPTSGSKAARQSADAALDATLTPPFERTAVNGFGFVQIVRPRHRPSLVELAQDRAAFEARLLLRRVAKDGPGAKRVVAHPSIIALLDKRTDWLDSLATQIGGRIELRADTVLPISGGYAEPL